MGGFTWFVILAEMRTGSNFLETNLNAIAGITCHGEAFNPAFIGGPDRQELAGMTLAERSAAPLRLLARLRETTKGMAGFRYFHDHDPRVLDAILDDPACAKIVLTRNALDSYVSWKIARESDQWRLGSTKNLKTARPRFEAGEFLGRLAETQAFQARVLHRLQASGQTAFYLDYDDILSLEVLNGLAAFLGVPGRLSELDRSLKKQNPEAAVEKVSNPEEMARALGRIDWFGMRQTPNFEPARHAAVPQYLACEGAPLLFLPIKSAPEAGIRAWLEGFGPLAAEFDRQGLRKWRQAHPGHRSFTVLRHPLARAHAAWAELLARDAVAGLRPYLARVHRLDLPPPGQGFATVSAHRQGFLGFLQFLRFLLEGRTELKVPPAFASQTATLAGFASLQAPDLVLREDRLQAGLDFLAAEAGLAPRPLPPEPAAEGVSLAEIHDAEVEAAARAAYGRDYIGLGFGPWRG